MKVGTCWNPNLHSPQSFATPKICQLFCGESPLPSYSGVVVPLGEKRWVHRVHVFVSTPKSTQTDSSKLEIGTNNSIYNFRPLDCSITESYNTLGHFHLHPWVNLTRVPSPHLKQVLHYGSLCLPLILVHNRLKSP